jgi:SnoaL-like polyketide cyclase
MGKQMRLVSNALMATTTCLLLAFCSISPSFAQDRVNKPDDFKATTPAGADSRVNRTLEDFQSERKALEKNLDNFDDLDFNVYSHQKWGEFDRSHAKDVIVHYPDGSVTYGLKNHIDRIKKIFTFAPDAANPIHHVRIGQGHYTAVTGLWLGTFTKPMVLPNGKTIQPNNKKFNLEMATVARWNDQGTIDEEWLFWDDYTFLKQIGILK